MGRPDQTVGPKIDGVHVPMLCLWCGHIGNLYACPQCAHDYHKLYPMAEGYGVIRVPARAHEITAWTLGGDPAVKVMLDG